MKWWNDKWNDEMINEIMKWWMKLWNVEIMKWWNDWWRWNDEMMN